MSATFIALSGPSYSGKSTIMENIRKLDHASALHKLPDMKDVVWQNLVDTGIFKNFNEITKDSDYLLIYIGRMVNWYVSMYEKYNRLEGNHIVIYDGCHIDLLIYSMLNLWYHYPVKEIQEAEVRRILDTKEFVSLIYMCKADDGEYPVNYHNLRDSRTAFRKNRKLELDYYEMFSESSRVVKLPYTCFPDHGERCAEFIIDDMRRRGLI